MDTNGNIGDLTDAQQQYCLLVPRELRRQFQLTDPASTPSGFLHVGCGSGWCHSFRGWQEQLWRRASADATLLLLSRRLGGSCPHCGIVEGIHRRIDSVDEAGIVNYPLARRPKIKQRTARLLHRDILSELDSIRDVKENFPRHV